MAVYDVFLSYRRSDGSDLAKDLYQKLQRVGLRVFFDQSEMVDGHYFNTQISAALKQAPNYLLVATPEVFPFRDEAQESDWVKKEIELAFEQYEQDQQNRSLNKKQFAGKSKKFGPSKSNQEFLVTSVIRITKDFESCVPCKSSEHLARSASLAGGEQTTRASFCLSPRQRKHHATGKAP